jgi:hypothetical protein
MLHAPCAMPMRCSRKWQNDLLCSQPEADLSATTPHLLLQYLSGGPLRMVPWSRGLIYPHLARHSPLLQLRQLHSTTLHSRLPAPTPWHFASSALHIPVSDAQRFRLPVTPFADQSFFLLSLNSSARLIFTISASWGGCLQRRPHTRLSHWLPKRSPLFRTHTFITRTGSTPR